MFALEAQLSQLLLPRFVGLFVLLVFFLLHREHRFDWCGFVWGWDVVVFVEILYIA